MEPSAHKTKTATCGRAHGGLNPNDEGSETPDGRTEPTQRCGEPSDKHARYRQGQSKRKIANDPVLSAHAICPPLWRGGPLPKISPVPGLRASTGTRIGLHAATDTGWPARYFGVPPAGVAGIAEARTNQATARDTERDLPPHAAWLRPLARPHRSPHPRYRPFCRIAGNGRDSPAPSTTPRTLPLFSGDAHGLSPPGLGRLRGSL